MTRNYTEADLRWLARLVEKKGEIGVRVNEHGELEPYFEIVTEDKEEAERASRIMEKIVGHPPSFFVTRGRKNNTK